MPKVKAIIKKRFIATLPLLLLIVITVFILPNPPGGHSDTPSESQTADGYKTYMTEDRKVEWGTSLSEATEFIESMDPATIRMKDQTPGLSTCQTLVWHVPAELLMSVNVVGIDDRGDLTYETIFNSDSKSTAAAYAYILAHPEMKPEVEAGCTTALDEFNRLEVATEGSSSDVWIKPLATGTLIDESK